MGNNFRPTDPPWSRPAEEVRLLTEHREFLQTIGRLPQDDEIDFMLAVEVASFLGDHFLPDRYDHSFLRGENLRRIVSFFIDEFSRFETPQVFQIIEIQEETGVAQATTSRKTTDLEEIGIAAKIGRIPGPGVNIKLHDPFVGFLKRYKEIFPFIPFPPVDAQWMMIALAEEGESGSGVVNHSLELEFVPPFFREVAGQRCEVEVRPDGVGFMEVIFRAEDFDVVDWDTFTTQVRRRGQEILMAATYDRHNGFGFTHDQIPNDAVQPVTEAMAVIDCNCDLECRHFEISFPDEWL